MSSCCFPFFRSSKAENTATPLAIEVNIAAGPPPSDFEMVGRESDKQSQAATLLQRNVRKWHVQLPGAQTGVHIGSNRSVPQQLQRLDLAKSDIAFMDPLYYLYPVRTQPALREALLALDSYPEQVAQLTDALKQGRWQDPIWDWTMPHPPFSKAIDLALYAYIQGNLRRNLFIDAVMVINLRKLFTVPDGAMSDKKAQALPAFSFAKEWRDGHNENVSCKPIPTAVFCEPVFESNGQLTLEAQNYLELIGDRLGECEGNFERSKLNRRLSQVNSRQSFIFIVVIPKHESLRLTQMQHSWLEVLRKSNQCPHMAVEVSSDGTKTYTIPNMDLLGYIESSRAFIPRFRRSTPGVVITAGSIGAKTATAIRSMGCIMTASMDERVTTNHIHEHDRDLDPVSVMLHDIYVHLPAMQDFPAQFRTTYVNFLDNAVAHAMAQIVMDKEMQESLQHARDSFTSFAFGTTSLHSKQSADSEKVFVNHFLGHFYSKAAEADRAKVKPFLAALEQHLKSQLDIVAGAEGHIGTPYRRTIENIAKGAKINMT